jgi:hypothetical protein
MKFTVHSVDHFYKQLNFMFNLLVAGPLAFFILLYLEYKQGSNDSIRDPIWEAVIMVVAVGLLVIAEVYLQRQKKEVTNAIPLKERFEFYLPIFLTRGTMSVMACFLALIGLYLTYSGYYIALFFVCFGYLSLVRPSDRKLSRHLKFNKKDIIMMEKRVVFDDPPAD